MRIRKEIFTGLMVIMLLVAGFSMFMRYQTDKGRSAFAKELAELGNNPTESIESLKRAIELYEKRIEQHVNDAAQTGIYWKILATRFQSRGFHGDALKALERAIEYNPVDPTLHHLTGISATVTAKSKHDFTGTGSGEKIMYFNLAESAFLRAIDIDPNYMRPRYSLGVLYAYDMDRYEEAITHLTKAMSLIPGDIDTMFALAYAYVGASFYREAVEVYDMIIRQTKDKERLRNAQEFRQTIMSRIYG